MRYGLAGSISGKRFRNRPKLRVKIGASSQPTAEKPSGQHVALDSGERF
jgi:hypothetical protein